MGIGDHRTGASQSAGVQRAQARCTERFVLAVANVDSEHFSANVCADAGGDDNRAGHELAQTIVAEVNVSGVDIHARELDMAQGPVPERTGAFNGSGTHAGDFRSRDAGFDAHRSDQIVDVRVDTSSRGVTG